MKKIRIVNINFNLYSIFIVFFFPLITLAEINSDITRQIGILPNRIIENTLFQILPDSLNQRVLSSFSNSAYNLLSNDGIPFYSLFDGKYNFDFLKYQNFDNSYSNIDSVKDEVIRNKDTSANNFILFSSNFNGLFNFRLNKQKKHFYYKIHSIFESSGGYYYSDRKSESVLGLKFLENSSYQNLGISASTGFYNRRSDISINVLFNKSNLYVPIRLADSTLLSRNFRNYDSFHGFLKFDNFFSEKIHIFGNFFLRKAVRNYGASADSIKIPVTLYHSKMEVDEYNYGVNLFLDINALGLKSPTRALAEYIQNIFLFSNEGSQTRVRTESENLKLNLSQKFQISDNLFANIIVGLNSRAVLYTAFEALPGNKSNYELLGNINYFKENSLLTFQVNKYKVFPFIADYFALQPNQIGNLNLKSENWTDIFISYNYFYSSRYMIELKGSLAYGKNINYPVYFDSARYQYKSDGELSGLSSELKLCGNVYNIDIEAKSRVFISFELNEKIGLMQPYRIPKFSQILLIKKNFDFGLSIYLNSLFQSGLASYNFKNKQIEYLSNYFTADLIINQKIFTQNLFIAIRNLTNQYYELNYSVPEPGINFLLGLSLTF